MIADRQVFVVRQQRIVGAEQLAGIGGVVDAGKEVGVIADRGWKLQAAVGAAMNEPGAQGFDAGPVAAVGVEDLADPMPQGEPRLAAEREQRVQGRAGRGLRGLCGAAVEQAEFQRRGKVEDVIADRDAAARAAARRREHAQRQVLDREVDVMVRRGDPTAPPGCMGLIDHD